MPIVTCKGKNREGKVAMEITSKGYCSTKNMYYYGIEKIEIQRASKVRATKGLLVHTFGKLAIALLTYVNF